MPKHEQHAFGSEAEPASADRSSGGGPQGALRRSRGTTGTVGNVIHMDRKRDERRGRADATNADATPDAGAAESSADRSRVADQIGRQLRGMYDGILSQPVPDRFMELVKRLEGGGAKGEDEK